jgi:thiol-disulfide isomerase/thioredoxin
MKIIKPWITAVLLVLSLQTIAQENEKQLHIGDKVPDIVFTGMYNHPSSTAKLSDFKGKAVILDFWSKGCSSCIASFPKMQKMQEEFKNDLVILLVNDQPSETKEALKLLFANSPILKHTKLPMVLGDPQFKLGGDLFPHHGTPYHVWIDREGIIKAMTWGLSTRFQDVRDLIDGKSLNIAMLSSLSNEESFDAKKPQSLLNYGNGILTKYIVYYNKLIPQRTIDDEQTRNIMEKSIMNSSFPYYSMLMKNPGFDLGNKVRVSFGFIYNASGTVIGFRTPGSMMSLYSQAYNVDMYQTKIIIDKDPDRYYEPVNESNDDRAFWFKNNQFVYEFTTPHYDQAKLLNLEILKEDLSNYFKLSGDIELRGVKSVVLYRTGGPLKLDTKGGESIYEDTQSEKGAILQNVTTDAIRGYLTGFHLNQKKDYPVFIDETGIDRNKKIDMVIHGSLNDIFSLNKELAKYGLGIKEEQRMLSVLVLRNISNN